MERAFYALYYPLGAVFLLTPSGWLYVRPEEVLLTGVGTVLLAAGVIYKLRLTKKSALTAQ